MNDITPAAKPLSEKAMLVRLTRRAPATSRRNRAAEAILEQELGDDANVVSTKLFKNPHNPVRRLLNVYGQKYRLHQRFSLPHEDRGARLLPVTAYERYFNAQREVDANIDRLKPAVIGEYDKWVQQDLDERRAHAVAAGKESTAQLADYPSKDDFEHKLSARVVFTPLPDARHPLFDQSDDELRDIQERMREEIAAMEQLSAERIKADLRDRMAEPLKHLIDKLKHPPGTEGAVFRNSAMTNIVDACDEVEALCMGDESLLAVARELRSAVRPHASNPQVVRDSPVVREAAVARLAEVASRMGFVGGV